MKLTFIEAARGVEKEMTVSIMDACGSCKGNGSEPGTSAERFVENKNTKICQNGSAVSLLACLIIYTVTLEFRFKLVVGGGVLISRTLPNR